MRITFIEKSYTKHDGQIIKDIFGLKVWRFMQCVFIACEGKDYILKLSGRPLAFASC